MTALTHYLFRIAAIVFLPFLAQAHDLMAPSGQVMTLDEQLVVPPDHNILYLGFTSPLIGLDYNENFDHLSKEMDRLCEIVGIPEAAKLIEQGEQIEELVIRLMEQLIPYGEVNPDLIQYLNVYDIRQGTCLWM